MTPELAIDLVRDAVFVILILVTLILVPGLIVGLMVSVFQAATQINEQTLSFLPRLLVTLFVLIVAGPYMMTKILDYSERLWTSIPLLIG
ncbi:MULTISPECIES: flagellar biosynthesis protein FliQ [unclassified Oleiphilus]|jgi:flagellar biosynthetic protein FliQ|uniref:flagellar biosynthesis protein FliQ n=1 Tax=unclassified Oleiphilus TaxID=2631174 RepID=UPI0007C343EC|nr:MULTISPECIES: flagellar biosynthesis protein FliQ [unclassified Oleiphilus]KZY47166.1 flagellar biosynthetic protein FliQ [Oleiphilus sp. HI0050]KZY74090.1 flagellar biosynthetic protein FliQ [Oleiphilus sp. HI0068]KZY80193.1 flagellar biosynthetic protein FliQ [Oleiphilus sp. HI0069]KZY85798.1 flagellar biosynthetic protein FliQ [Oleiphilus sp. HI0072]KZZ10362.1 flagellar biosynthetic protein FliQ [Oleiphilus sp. HI0078]KZZ29819.1 flagellar biosynthetic protein FliQ [Oleiphilus sp. HI0081